MDVYDYIMDLMSCYYILTNDTTHYQVDTTLPQLCFKFPNINLPGDPLITISGAKVLYSLTDNWIYPSLYNKTVWYAAVELLLQDRSTPISFPSIIVFPSLDILSMHLIRYIVRLQLLDIINSTKIYVYENNETIELHEIPYLPRHVTTYNDYIEYLKKYTDIDIEYAISDLNNVVPPGLVIYTSFFKPFEYTNLRALYVTPSASGLYVANKTSKLPTLPIFTKCTIYYTLLACIMFLLDIDEYNNNYTQLTYIRSTNFANKLAKFIQRDHDITNPVEKLYV